MKKWKYFLKRGIAVSAACALMAVSIPFPAAQAEDGDSGDNQKLILQYDFKSLKSGTIANDVSGNGQAGVVRPEGSGVETKDVTIGGTEYTAFVMQGGQPDENHTYLEMPNGILNGLEDVTISCYTYVEKNTGYQRIWDIGHDATSYMYLLADGANEGHTGYTSALTAGGWGKEKGPEKGESLKNKEWVQTIVTFDGSEKTMSLYEDGKLIGSEQTDADLSALKDSNQNWIGYGQFKNDILSGMVADFKIYSYAMTSEEIAAQFAIDDNERVARDKKALDLGDTSAVTQNITLPATGEMGSAITWESSNPEVIATDGTVTRPDAGSGDAAVTLTAHISYGDAEDTKIFEAAVKQKLTPKEIVNQDAEAIDLGNLAAVTTNLTLPTEGTLGSSIAWSSSNPSIIADDGTVTRPVGTGQKVTLTAAVSYEDESITKTFEAAVVPLYERKDIVKVEAVTVETGLGMLPSLPNQVNVTYEDDTAGTEKVIWPTDLKVDDFKKKGTVQVTGTIVDRDDKVTANVKVTDAGQDAPQKSASGFDLGDITLNGDDTIFGQNMGRALEYLKVMDADRMLYNFRNTYGQDTKGAKPLTGWEEPSGLLRGHSTGHFLSGLAQAYASTGDKEYKDKMDYMISELRKLQQLSQGEPEDFTTACSPTSAAQSKWSTDPSTWGKGFLSAYSPDQFALLEQYTPYATIWAPYYTLHKLLAGFIDCYNYAGNEEALAIAKDLGTWVNERLSACTKEQRSKMWSMYIAGEYGGMNESLTRLYEITKDESYLKTAQMFDNTDFFNGLANNVDTIQGRHANQHIPQIIGAIHEYQASGDDKYYRIAKNFWDMATSRYAYSIGGVGTGERFKDPYKQGNNILGNEGRGENCETCAAYNLLKLTMDLYNYNPDDAAYMDYYERTLINQIAASQSQESTNTMHNGVTYMLPVDPGQRRDYDSDYGGFTCCNGTGMENHVKYQAAAYAQSGNNLYVNLYMPTTVNWAEKGISIKQETKFPSEHSKLTVKGSADFTMKLRVPYWATKGFTVKVNGETICEKPEVSSYVEIKRSFKDGDVITIDMPYTLHLDKTPDKVDDSTVASIMYGPLVMVAKDTRKSYVPMNWYQVVLGEDLNETIDIVTGTDKDKVPNLKTNGLNFYPMYDAYNYRYHTYVKVETSKSVVNKEALQKLVDSVTGDKALDKADYEAAGFVTFEKALADATSILAKQDATQSEIYEAYKALEAAIDNLKKAEDDTKPDDSGKPDDGSGKPDDSSAKPDGKDKSDHSNTDKNAPGYGDGSVKTGDTSSVLLWVVVAVIAVAGGGIVLYFRRKRK